MKKLLSIALALSLFTACNNDKKADKDADTTTTTTTNTTTPTGWDEGNRSAFISKCIEGTKAQMTDDKAKSYCSCMLDKLEARYPVADSTSNMTMTQMSELAKDCVR
jgi:hypothetical protein